MNLLPGIKVGTLWRSKLCLCKYLLNSAGYVLQSEVVAGCGLDVERLLHLHVARWSGVHLVMVRWRSRQCCGCEAHQKNQSVEKSGHFPKFFLSPFFISVPLTLLCCSIYTRVALPIAHLLWVYCFRNDEHYMCGLMLEVQISDKSPHFIDRTVFMTQRADL